MTEEKKILIPEKTIEALLIRPTKEILDEIRKYWEEQSPERFQK